jgi:hypothetical protein
MRLSLRKAKSDSPTALYVWPVAEWIWDLAPGATETYTLTTPALADVDWERLHYIVLVDYQASGMTGPYDTLQAVYALASIEGEPLRM